MQLTMVVAGGGQLTRRQHLLSRDGRMLLVCTANTVRVYGSATGERLFDLQGHTDEVTDLCLHPGISSQVRLSKLWTMTLSMVDFYIVCYLLPGFFVALSI